MKIENLFSNGAFLLLSCFARKFSFVGLLVPLVFVAGCAVPKKVIPSAAPQKLTVNSDGLVVLKSREVRILSSDVKNYPVELSEKGVGGKVLLEGKLSTEGILTDVKVKETSRSKELDQAALRYASEAKYLKASQDALITLPIIFVRDYDLLVVSTTPCGVIKKDVDYYKATYPELKPSDMWYMDVIFGLATTYNINHGARPKKVSDDQAIEIVLSVCKNDPKLSFFQMIYFTLYGIDISTIKNNSSK